MRNIGFHLAAKNSVLCMSASYLVQFRVEVGAFVIPDLGCVVAKQVETVFAGGPQKVFRAERRLGNETTERFQLFDPLPADVGVMLQVAGQGTGDFVPGGGEGFDKPKSRE